MNRQPDRGPDFYIADDDLLAAAEIAYELGQPLLLTGEPGTGKTRFAEHVARTLAPRWLHRDQAGDAAKALQALPLYTFETKSTSQATDLFYRFDNLRRFHAVHDRSMSNLTRDYLSYDALGLAILATLTDEQLAGLLPAGMERPVRGASVVLVDEIDKAPRDFPNDLLNEIDRMFFRIPELPQLSPPGPTVVRCADDQLRPIVILTSNSEKNLPIPFLRRCVFHHIKFPNREKKAHLRSILAANLGGSASPITDAAIDFFYDVREGLVLEKQPTSRELSQWIRMMTLRSPELADSSHSGGQVALSAVPVSVLTQTLVTLGKTAADLGKIKDLATKRFSR